MKINLNLWFHYGIRPVLVRIGRKVLKIITLNYPMNYLPKCLRYFTPSDKYPLAQLARGQSKPLA
jgi:hypothetical protein